MRADRGGATRGIENQMSTWHIGRERSMRSFAVLFRGLWEKVASRRAAARRAESHRVRPGVESLDERLLLAVTPLSPWQVAPPTAPPRVAGLPPLALPPQGGLASPMVPNTFWWTLRDTYGLDPRFPSVNVGRAMDNSGALTGLAFI